MTSLDHQQVVDALPQYEVGEEIGRGGWGLVLGGRHRQLDRLVAIKQLPRAFAADQAVRARFTAEARLLASLDHPHIVPVYDYVERDGLCLLVMEMLPGGTVWSRFADEGFTQPAAVAVALAGAVGLHAAHGRKVLHRDVKPENLMFSAAGTVKVTDFGIAKVVGGDETLATRAGDVLGTPAYIAPEQARGGLLTPATDVYALATMLYELLSGTLPFPDDGDAMALLFKHAFEDPVSLSETAPAVPAEVAGVVMRALATDPEDRFASAEGFAVALAEACTAAWGPGWLLAQSVPVMGAAAVVAATTEQPAVGSAHAPAPAPGPETVVSAPVARQPAPPTALSASAAPTAALRPPPAVRPAQTVHVRGAGLEDLTGEELVPLSRVVATPPGAGRPLLLAAGLFVVLAALALTGLFAPTTGPALPAGALEVGGTPVSTGALVSVDLSRPLSVVVGPGLPSGDQVRSVRLSFGALGIHAASSTVALDVAAGARSARIDESGARFLVAGRVTGEIDLLAADGSVVATERFAARTTQPGVVSAAGAVVALLLLFTAAYTESFLRSLRRGRRRVTGVAGLVCMGVLAALVVAGIAWLVAGREPTVVELVVCAVLGAASWGALAQAGIRIGRRRSLRRAAAKVAPA